MASPACSSTVSVKTTITYNLTAPLTTYTGTPNINENQTISSANLAFCYEALITSNSTQTITLNNGSINDDYGNALTFNNVKNITIENNGTNNIVVGGGTDPVMGSDQMTIAPGTTGISMNVWTVSSSAKQLTITPASGSGNNYQVIIAGN